MTTESQTVLQAYLHKSPPLGKRGLKIWHKRWVILCNDKKLYYYRSERSTTPLGSIDISTCVRLDCGLDHKKYRHIFAIVCKERTHFLSASSEHMMEEWVSAICQMRSTDYGLHTGFKPVWRPSRHSLERTDGNEEDVEASTTSPLLRMLKRSWSVSSPKRKSQLKTKRQISMGDFARQGSETPPLVDRSLKPPPPVHRHLKPPCFHAALSPGGTDSALSSGHVTSSSPVEGDVFMFPAVNVNTDKNDTHIPSASSSPGMDIPQMVLCDSAIDVRKAADNFTSHWISDQSPQQSPFVQRASRLVGFHLSQADSFTSIDQLSPVQGSSCDSGAESEEGGTEEPVKTSNTRTYHYTVQRTDATTDDDVSDADSPKLNTERWHSMFLTRQGDKLNLPTPKSKPIESQV